MVLGDAAGPTGRGSRVLVVDDGASATALALVRGLAASGAVVGLAGPGPTAAAWSRAVRYRYRVSSAGTDPEAFVRDVSGVLRAGGYRFVLATGDVELLLLSEHRDALPADLSLPPHACLVDALDKRSLTARGVEAGFRVPRTVSAHEVPVDDPATWVVKPALHSRPLPPGPAARVLAGGRQVRLAADLLGAAGGEPVAQDVVRGPLVALVLLVDGEGRTVATVQQRATRLWPPTAGTSASARTEPVDPALLAAAERLLRALRWRGLAQLQLLHPVGEQPALVDLNARPYGSMALARAAGVDLPGLWLRQARGESLAPVTGRTGVRYSSTVVDVRSALARRGGAGGVRDVVGAALGGLGAAHPVWSPSDPLPAVRRSAHVLARRITRAAGATARG